MKSAHLLTVIETMFAMLPKRDRPVSIPSHKVTFSNQKGTQLSKRDMQKMKGKKARKNRGKNRSNG